MSYFPDEILVSCWPCHHYGAGSEGEVNGWCHLDGCFGWNLVIFLGDWSYLVRSNAQIANERRRKVRARQRMDVRDGEERAQSWVRCQESRGLPESLGEQDRG